MDNFINQLKGDNEKLIVSMAMYYRVDPYMAWQVAKCESGFDEEAKSKYSSATGLFQFIDSTWNHYCTGDRLNAVDNTRCAMQIMAKGGWSHWECYNNMFAQR